MSTTLTREQTVIDALCEISRPILLEYFDRSSCIVSTRIGIEVLKYFGITGVPIPVRFSIANDEWLQYREAGHSMEETHQHGLKWSAEDPGGPWMLAVHGSAKRSNSRSWDGHLVIGVEQQNMLIDLSADQFNRPIKNITIEAPLVLETDRAWWADPEGKYGATGPTRAGERVGINLDRLVVDKAGYRNSMDWRGRAALVSQLTGRIIRDMKAVL